MLTTFKFISSAQICLLRYSLVHPPSPVTSPLGCLSDIAHLTCLLILSFYLRIHYSPNLPHLSKQYLIDSITPSRSPRFMANASVSSTCQVEIICISWKFRTQGYCKFFYLPSFPLSPGSWLSVLFFHSNAFTELLII